jgi:hypothetical protein
MNINLQLTITLIFLIIASCRTKTGFHSNDSYSGVITNYLVNKEYISDANYSFENSKIDFFKIKEIIKNSYVGMPIKMFWLNNYPEEINCNTPIDSIKTKEYKLIIPIMSGNSVIMLVEFCFNTKSKAWEWTGSGSSLNNDISFPEELIKNFYIKRGCCPFFINYWHHPQATAFAFSNQTVKDLHVINYSVFDTIEILNNNRDCRVLKDMLKINTKRELKPDMIELPEGYRNYKKEIYKNINTFGN